RRIALTAARGPFDGRELQLADIQVIDFDAVLRVGEIGLAKGKQRAAALPADKQRALLVKVEAIAAALHGQTARDRGTAADELEAGAGMRRIIAGQRGGKHVWRRSSHFPTDQNLTLSVVQTGMVNAGLSVASPANYRERSYIRRRARMRR